MASNIDLDACFELVMQLVNQAGEVSIQELGQSPKTLAYQSLMFVAF